MSARTSATRKRTIFKAILLCILSVVTACSLSGCLTAALITAATTEGFLGSGNDQSTYEPADFGTDDGKTDMTIMFYVIGSNLESQSGLATTDLQEMLDANLGRHVNIAVEAGGAKRWRNNVFEDGKVTRAIIDNSGISVAERLGKVNMGNYDELTDFILWAKQTCPADRYALILWDHGGGTIAGFGQDEMFHDSGMEINEIRHALKSADTHFDFIGFDACLMATIETAVAVAPWADYLIASEETEPGSGWYYTEWLTALGKNPSVDIATLGKKIISDYTSGNTYWEEFTLSLVDLSKVDEVYEELCKYLDSTHDMLTSRHDYRQIANARSSCKAFGEGEYEQIDIVSYVDTLSNGGRNVIEAMNDAVIYYGGNSRGAYGLAMYFPYTYPQYYSEVRGYLKAVGMNDNRYLGFFDDYISITSGSQLFNVFRGTTVVEELTGFDQAAEQEAEQTEEELENVADSSWYTDPEELGYTEEDLTTLGTEDLVLEEKDDTFVLHLTDDQWKDVTMVEMSVLLEMDGGYLDLGVDSRYEFDDDGDLLVDYDYYWLAFDGHIVPFYNVENTTDVDGYWYSYGYVPAVLNGTDDILIKVYWDEDHRKGVVAGYRYENGETPENGSLGASVYQRDVQQFQPTDEVTIYFDFYNSEGELDSSYSLYDPIVVGNGGINVSYHEVAEYPSDVCMILTDIYGNTHYTESVRFWFE